MPSLSNWLLLMTLCGDKLYQVAEQECMQCGSDAKPQCYSQGTSTGSAAAAAAAAAAAVLWGCLPLCFAARWSVICLLSHPAHASSHGEAEVAMLAGPRGCEETDAAAFGGPQGPAGCEN